MQTKRTKPSKQELTLKVWTPQRKRKCTCNPIPEITTDTQTFSNRAAAAILVPAPTLAQPRGPPRTHSYLNEPVFTADHPPPPKGPFHTINKYRSKLTISLFLDPFRTSHTTPFFPAGNDPHSSLPTQTCPPKPTNSTLDPTKQVKITRAPLCGRQCKCKHRVKTCMCNTKDERQDIVRSSNGAQEQKDPCTLSSHASPVAQLRSRTGCNLWER